jgi:DNA-binding transcriptional ArsR family regulator
LVWVTLEEVALDAMPQGGRLVASTSARQVAERLGIDPGTAAAALRVLRERGLVELEREKGPAGRFGLSVYTLRPIAGLTVVQPRAGEPCVVSPPVAQPATVSPAPAGPYVDTAHVGAPSVRAKADRTAPGTPPPRMDSSLVAATSDGSSVHGRAGSARRPGHSTSMDAQSALSVQCSGQETFDLGTGS